MQDEGAEPMGHVKGIWPKYKKKFLPPMYTGVDPYLRWNTYDDAVRQKNHQKKIYNVPTPYKGLINYPENGRDYVYARPYPHWDLD
jgi:hypothetical protein